MRDFFAVFYGCSRRILSDPTNIFLLILFPLLLIVILGSALNAVMTDDGSIEVSVIGFYSDDSKSEIETFLTSEDFSEIFRLVKLSENEIENELLNEDSKIDVGLIEIGGELTLIKATNENAYSVLQSVLTSREMIYAATEISFKNGGNPLPFLDKTVGVNNIYLGGEKRTSTDYYAITMSVMFLLFSGIYTCETFEKHIKSPFGKRLQASPIKRSTVLLATLTAPTFNAFLNGIIVMLITKFVFGVNWGDNLLIVVLTLFITTLFAQVLYFFMYMVFKNADAANGIMQGLIWIMTFSSNGMVQINWGNFQRILNFMPNKMIHDILFTTIYGGDNTVIVRNFIILLTIITVLIGICIVLGRKQVEE